MKNKPGKIKAKILNWLGVPIDLNNSSFWENWISTSNSAGQIVTEETVLSLSAAWSCTRIISETVATLPLHIYERTNNGRRIATEHPLYNILHSRPNSYSSSVTYFESKMAAMLLRGNGFSRKKMINGRIVSLQFIPPSKLQIKEKSDKSLEFYFIESDGSQTKIQKNELFHIPGFSLDGKYGISAIKYGAGVFGSALAASDASNGVFENGLMPTVAFTMDRVLTKDQRSEFRQNLKEITGAMNSGKSPLLEAGMKVESVGISPEDAQLLESRAYSVEEVCRWFRVDPSLVGHGNKDSNWGTGLEQKLIAFLTFTLAPWLRRIESAIDHELLSPSDRGRYYAEFSLDGILRADSAARANFYSIMVNNGIMTRDEVRLKENLPQRGGNADKLTIQTSMATIDSIGKTDNSVMNALKKWLDQQEDKSNES